MEILQAMRLDSDRRIYGVIAYSSSSTSAIVLSSTSILISRSTRLPSPRPQRLSSGSERMEVDIGRDNKGNCKDNGP